MKKLILLALLCISAYASQAQSITIYNNTTCTIYYKLFGDVSTTCGAAYSSGVYSLAGGASAYYASPISIPLYNSGGISIPVTGYFHLIHIYNSDPAIPVCPSHNVISLSTCSPTSGFIDILDADCTDECAAQAKWRLVSGTNNVEVTVQ